ncbi:MAG: PglZ domain-containing protein [Spirosoma sp.]|nr:PglZ domain-containing protein [Spirosoma sp.]
MLTLDPFRLSPPDGALVIDSETAYVEARRQILAYRLGTVSKAPTFVVYETPYLFWFNDLPDEERTDVTPRSELARQHPAARIPAELTDADIQELNLLGSAVEPTRAGLFRHYFGQLPEQVEPKPETLLMLAQFVGQHLPVLQKRYPAQFWRDYLKPFPHVLTPLREGDSAFCRALAEGIYLAGIPVLLTDWEHSHTNTFKSKYGIKLNELLPLISWTKRAFADDPALEMLLEKRLIEQLKLSKDAPKTLLPGLYKAEVKALLASTQKMTAEQRQQIEEKYADLLTPELRQQLETRVPPTLPPLPNLDGLLLSQQANAWKQWAVSGFIPHKFWLDGLPEPTLAQLEPVTQMAEQYGDWLFANFASLLAHNDVSTNYGVSRRVKECLETNDSRVIWLIIDGFPAVFVPLLQQALRAHGLIRQTTSYAFAPLPTITEVGIPALLNGLTPDSSAFTTNREEALKRSFPNYTTAFTAALGQFQHTLSLDTDLCCLHWLEIDEMLHRDDTKFDTPRTEKIIELLNERIGKIAAFINQQTDRPIKLVISTDHGATKCLQNGQNIKNAKITEAAAANPRERSVKLDGKLLSVHLDPTETYHLTTDVTRNPTAYVAARGYRYFGSNDRGYRHGGLTPEETIVPVVLAEMAIFIVEPLVLTYYGSSDGLPQGKTIKDFGIQVRNPNPFAIELLTLSIVEDENAQFTLPMRIEPTASATLTGSVKIAQKYKPQQGQLSLAVSITFRANAEESAQSATLTVPIQTSELDDFDFDF